MRSTLLWGSLSAALLIVLFAVMQIPSVQAGFAAWGQGLAPIQFLSSVLTPLGVVTAVVGLLINGRAATRTLQQSIASGRMAQFQNACVLAASPNVVSKTGGVYMLYELAANAPLDFLSTVFKTLDAVVIDLDAPFKKSFGYFAHPMAADGRTYDRSDPVAVDVIEVISMLQKKLPKWQDLAKDSLPDGEITINLLFLNRFVIGDYRPNYVYFNKMVLGRMVFQKCELRHSTFRGAVLEPVDFESIDFRNACIDLVGPDLTPVMPHHGLLNFNGCQTDGLVISGMSYAEWCATPAPDESAPRRTRRRASAPISTQSQPAA